MFTFTTTAATGFGVLAACTGNSEMSAAFYGAPCIGDDGGACYTPPPSEGFDGAGYGSQPDANLLDASADGDATFLDDSGDAGEDAD